MLGISRRTLFRWLKSGKIAAADKIEGHTGDYRFSYAAVARLAHERNAARAS